MTIEIGTKEWLEARRKLITATDAGVILGTNPWKTPLQLYHDKVSGSVSTQSAAMKRGLDLEPKARECFEAVTGHFVKQEFRIHPDIPWMAASFDGINSDGKVVELKCPGAEDHQAAVLGKVPEKYYAQCQHQMAVAMVGTMHYFSYRPNDIEPYAILTVTAEREYQKKMMEAEKEFWDRLQSKTPPEPSAKDIIFREDRDWLMMEEELQLLTVKCDAMEERKELLRKKMIDACAGKPTRGYKLRFVPIETKGSIDYQAIDELKTIDLEKYRKPSNIRWRMDQI